MNEYANYNLNNDGEDYIPIYKKLNLTINEAAKYSSIGINKLDALVRQPGCPFALRVGNKKMLIKREPFEEYIRDRRAV